MILVCPSCETRYFADDASVGKEGRKVRCAACGHSWFAKPDGGGEEESGGLSREQVERLRKAAVANAQPSGPHAEFRAREMARRKRNRVIAAGIAWGAGALVFAGAAAAALTFRNQVANVFPSTASAYKIVGLEVNRFGLELSGVEGKRSFEGTTPVLTVTGVATNSGTTDRTAPLVRIALLDEAGEELHAWTDRLDAARIAAGASAGFSSRVVDPPLETVRLAVTFAEAGPDETPDALHAVDGVHTDAPAGPGAGHETGPGAGPDADHASDGAADHASGQGTDHGAGEAPAAPAAAPPAADDLAAGGEHH
ncbi:hypothetical protein GC169_02210 [bacterium]|nr:hypothetical protein [bacterium]